MAAPDFPASPTVGQTYTAPSGLVYTWDGKVWSTTGPLTATPAGGDLTGTYPNPTIATGVVTWPKLSLQSYASYGRVATLGVPNGAVTSITFDTLYQNVGGIGPAVPATTFTVQQTGLYAMTAMCLWTASAAGSLRRFVILIAGTNYVAWSDMAPNATVNGQTISAIVWATAGQTLVVQVYHDAGSALNLAPSGSTPAVFFGVARVA